ncbi:hypothetical protein FEM48_Zijuj04G0030800 [Ziziphus jujuba var. spinosa]|uniref:UDP-glycosyltransferase 90A1-like n=1 Tax=Ziziphus jujuba var. spinosa TaxID=714518 RepID=A0A978VHG9_ZIZJJ|nr:hypothetical protein FEM48_Zijuj04G0030800 [Ziziphus jujuba var. spinosa]
MGSNSLNSTPQKRHVVLFPFMSKGHTIPLLHLARLLLSRRFAVTVLTTPANRPFIVNSLSDTTASIIDLPFPDNIPKVPAGVESTDKFPSMSVFFSFVTATKRMQPDFERALESLPPVSFIVSDGFLWWTLESASKFSIPRLVFYGMSNYASAVSKVVYENRLIHGPESNNELLTVPDFPWIKITKNDFESMSSDPEVKDVAFEFHMNMIISTLNSFGLVVNSFYELEPVFVDYWNKKCSPKAYCVGPLCLAEPILSSNIRPTDQPAWIQWLDKKLEQGSSVLYVAFGSQAEISRQQLEEIALGLEESKVNFLWVKMVMELMEGQKGKEVRKKVKEVAEMAKKAVEESGSSKHTLDSLIDEICQRGDVRKA